MTAHGPSLGLAITPALRLLDAAGKLLQNAQPDNPSNDVTLRFGVPTDGAYTLEVRDLHGSASPRHAFLLRVIVEQPDFHREIMQGEWREVEAEPFLSEGNQPAAIAALEEAVKLRRAGEAMLMCGHVFAANRLAGTLSKLADLLEEAGDVQSAIDRRRDAAGLLKRFRLPATSLKRRRAR